MCLPYLGTYCCHSESEATSELASGPQDKPHAAQKAMIMAFLKYRTDVIIIITDSLKKHSWNCIVEYILDARNCMIIWHMYIIMFNWHFDVHIWWYPFLFQFKSYRILGFTTQVIVVLNFIKSVIAQVFWKIGTLISQGKIGIIIRHHIFIIHMNQSIRKYPVFWVIMGYITCHMEVAEVARKLQKVASIWKMLYSSPIKKVAKSCKNLQVIHVVSDSSNWHIIYVLESIDNNHKYHLTSIIECPRKHKYHYLADHQNHII